MLIKFSSFKLFTPTFLILGTIVSLFNTPAYADWLNALGQSPNCKSESNTTLNYFKLSASLCVVDGLAWNQTGIETLGNTCFNTLNQRLSAIKSSDCRKHIRKKLIPRLTQMVLQQFKPENDLLFKSYQLPLVLDGNGHRITPISEGFERHFEWIAGWSQSKALKGTLESSGFQAALEEILRALKGKLARIFVQDASSEDNFEAKLEHFNDVLRLMQPNVEKIDSNLQLDLTYFMLEQLRERFEVIAKVQSLSCAFDDCKKKDQSRDLYLLAKSIAKMGDNSGLHPNTERFASSSLNRFLIYVTQIARKSEPSFKSHSGINEVISSFSQMTSNYKKTGAFLTLPKTLWNGLNEASIREAKNRLSNLAGQLDPKQKSLTSDRLAIINQLMAQRGIDDKRDILFRELSRLKRQLGFKLKDIRGTQNAVALMENELGRQADHVLNYFQTAKFRDQYSRDMIAHEIQVSPSNAPQTGAVFAKNISIEVKKDDLIQIEVVGNWAPECAVQKAFAGKGDVGGNVGPEGYAVGAAQGHTIVHSENDYNDVTSEFTSEENSDVSCEGWNKSYNPDQDGGFFAKLGTAVVSAAAVVLAAPTGGTSLAIAGAALAGAGTGGQIASDIHSKSINDNGGTKVETSSFNKCQTKSKGSRSAKGKVTNDITTDDWRTGMNFSKGFKTAFAPFPQFAAGSLIAAEEWDQVLKPNETYLRPIQRNNTWVAPANGRIHFIVNDCHSSTRKSDEGELLIRVKRLESKQSLVRGLTAGLNLVTTEIAGQFQKYLQMGRISNEDMIELRSRVEAKLRERTAANNEGLALDFQQDQELRTFFQNWIDRAMVQLSRKLNLLQFHREAESIADEIAHLEAAIQRTQEDRSLLTAPMAWVLYDYEIAVKRIHSDLENLLEVISGQVEPVFSILTPSEKLGFKDLNFEHPNVDHLLHIEKIQNLVSNLAKSLGTRLDQNILSLKPAYYRFAIRYPKPLLEELEETGPASNIKKNIPIGSTESARNLWSTLQTNTGFPQGDWLSIRITPEDLYKGPDESGQGRLPCDLSAPIIETMAFVLKTKMDEASFSDYETSNYLDEWRSPNLQRFLTSQGNLFYELLNSAYTHSNLYAFRARTESDILQRVFPILENPGNRVYAGNGQGISPFGEFSIKRESLKTLIESSLGDDQDSLDEIAIIGLVRGVSSGSSKVWVPGKCQQAN